jgi:hypothetical protein
MVEYNSDSPWFNTAIVNNQYLDTLEIRPVPASSDDSRYTIEPTYTYRPDLLAYDLYDNHKLWWVFSQRNLDILRDPIYDFVAGTTIYLPQRRYLQEFLNL